MTAIVTLTFNPAIDKSTSVPLLIPEKKLNCTAPHYEPGGGGVNVARALKKLGAQATAIYLAGGITGKMYTQLLFKEAVNTIVVPTKGSTRENFIVEEIQTNKQYRFGLPGAQINEQEWQRCLSELEQLTEISYIVVSGSLPPGIPETIFSKITAIAQQKKAKLVVDTSGEALKHAVNAGVYLIKPSLGELAMLAGMENVTNDQVVEISRKVIEKGTCEVIVVSMGAAGAMLVTKELAIKVNAPEVKIRSTVGAGDSMVAGMVLSLLKNYSLEAALQYGVACGTAATVNPGTGLCDKEFVEEIYQIILNEATKE
ncbi:6-phosphofructokinase 2 [Pedobacter sp. CG_S7]|uniref:1-phosphofructokinase family hexose kinase n=1 Tax=Pedobacter sp. CG_S7 TaxID=3143930 RepID=UPI00339A5317